VAIDQNGGGQFKFEQGIQMKIPAGRIVPAVVRAVIEKTGGIPRQVAEE
jgi:hypothetical protein